MSHTMITFLGKGTRRDGSYREANYKFKSGNIYSTQFFGLALLKELAATGNPVDHLVVLGTGSSIWDALVLDEIIDEGLWDKLNERVEKGNVDDELLAGIAPEVERSFAKGYGQLKVSLTTIPFGRNQQEQITILQKMADLVETGDTVTIDISHGFRILPMIGLVSALFLTQLKEVTISGLYYGALEMTENDCTPVVSLDGLLNIIQWLNAMTVFQKTGDYGIFSSLLSDPNTSDSLCQAAFFEKIINIQQARGQLKKVRKSFKSLKDNDPIFSLFYDRLYNLTSWSEIQHFAGRQLFAARNALDTGNYVRAAALAVESLISARVAQNGGVFDRYDDRKQAREELNEQAKGIGRHSSDASARIYVELRDLRNSLAHGIRPDRNSFNQQKTLSSEILLSSRLKELFERVEEIIDSAS